MTALPDIAPLPVPAAPPHRTSPAFHPLPTLSSALRVQNSTNPYQSQYATIYFMRLARLKAPTMKRARKRWAKVEGHENPPKFVPRVLDITQGTLSFVIGTLYINMPLKPNVLDDLSRDHWLAAPQPRLKFFSPGDEIMLEDESGRVRLVGDKVKDARLVTGVIVAALGIEAEAGEFHVLDLCFAGQPAQAQAEKSEEMDVDGVGESSSSSAPLVAFVSGLDLGTGSAPADLRVQMLIEYLTGQGGSPEDQARAARMSRLIIAGNSMAAPVRHDDAKKPKRYGYDRSTYSASPTLSLDAVLSSLAPTLPIDLLPGADDPAGALLPQQPLPRAMFREASRWGSDAEEDGEGQGLRCCTNPAWVGVGGKTFLTTSGQTIDDIFKYVETDDRLAMAKDTLEWRHVAPTAPDTLWCYPFNDRDPFILSDCPHVYAIGNQPAFGTDLLVGDDAQRTRVVLLPRFSASGTIALVNTETLACESVTFEVPRWVGEAENGDGDRDVSGAKKEGG